jgi:hypothetical protein
MLACPRGTSKLPQERAATVFATVCGSWENLFWHKLAQKTALSFDAGSETVSGDYPQDIVT